MHRNNSVGSRFLRVCVFGLATISAAVVITTDSADARRRHHRHHARHHVERDSYNPAFASIIVDGNTGAVLSASNPDGLRHPASLTKILADAKTDRVLGVHILGPDAGTVIHECAIAMEFAGSAEDIARTCHAHPQLGETVKEAALAADKRALHI